MTVLVPDTNVLIDFFLGDADCGKTISSYDRVLVCTTVAGEYLAGCNPSTENGARFKAEFQSFLGNPSVKAVGGTSTTAEYYAMVYRGLKASGCKIPQNDMWIAAFALEHSAVLFSKDAHFSRIPMLRLA